MSGILDDANDMRGFVDFSQDLITNYKSKNWVDKDQIETAEEIFPLLAEKFEKLLNNHNRKGTIPSPSEAGELWEELTSLANDNTKPGWHMWRDDDVSLNGPDGKPTGYGGDILRSSTLLSASSLIQHYYSSVDELNPIKLNLMGVEQDPNQKMYIGHASASELDAICMVPWMDPSMTSERFGFKVLNNTMKDNEWQRVVDTKRVLDIRSFASRDNSFLFNPVLLYVDLSNKHVKEIKKLNGKGTLQVDFSFLKKRSEGWTDYVPRPGEGDTRPLWIIDGQHRIRGFGASHRGSKLQIPFVLIVNSGGEDMQKLVAQVFTEINTMSEPIDPLHQMYLRYMFAMKGRTSSSDFTVDGSSNPTASSRPQRRAYELALSMASERDSPLYNMIEFQKPSGRRRAHNLVVSAKNWVPQVRKWFTSSAIYADMNSDDFYLNEVMNFFKAFERVSNSNDWADKKPRWEVGATKNKPLLQFEGPFLSLLEIYPEVVENIINHGKVNRPISIEVFQSKIEPLQRVDWRSNLLLRSNLKGRTNNNIRHLKMWMLNVIEEGYSGTIEEILDSNERSIVGKGLIAPPEAPIIQIVSDVNWPSLMDLTLEAELPIHSLGINWDVRWITSRGPLEWSIPKSSLSQRKDSNKTSLTIKLDDLPDDCLKISIEAVARNGNGPAPSGRKEYPKE
jgi:DGQHR domain-containing protein